MTLFRKAILKLDRRLGVLHVTGTRSCIANVREQLENLSGPSLVVSAAVWAELMRTRTHDDPLQGAVAKIQQESGCRIHIERNMEVPRVRLFGKSESTAIAQLLLRKLEHMCVEEAIDIDFRMDFLWSQHLAEEFGVTLIAQESENTAALLGIQEAVAQASKEMHRACQKTRSVDDLDDAKEELAEAGSPSTAQKAIGAAMSTLFLDGGIASALTDGDTEQGDLLDDSDQLLSGFIMTKLSSTSTEVHAAQVDQDRFNGHACKTCGASAAYCVHCGRKILEYRPAGCPTCGTVRFCVYCGQPTERVKIPNAGAASENILREQINSTPCPWPNNAFAFHTGQYAADAWYAQGAK
jgi:hypothetical protein